MKDLNLIPKNYILAKKRKKQKIKLAFTIVMAVILLAVAVGTPLALNINLHWQRDALDKQVKDMNKYVERENQINSIKELYNLREQEGNRLRELGVDVKAIFDSIEKAISEKLFVASFNLIETKEKAAQVTLSGIAASEDDIATFVNYLRKNTLFESVVITEVRKMSANTAPVNVAPANNTPANATPAVGASANSTQLPQTTGEFSFNIILYLKAGK